MADTSIVYVIEEDAALCEPIAALLLCRGYCVTVFKSPDAFFSSPLPNIPACLIFDPFANGCHAVDLQKRIMHDLQIPTICLSSVCDIPTIVRAMRAGAIEFLVKPAPEEQLLPAVSQALKRAHEQWATTQVRRQVRENYSRLTPRERQILPYIVRGFLNKQTAYELGTSEITIRIHRGQIMRKMRASSLAELVWLASQLGIPERARDGAVVAARNDSLPAAASAGAGFRRTIPSAAVLSA